MADAADALRQTLLIEAHQNPTSNITVAAKAPAVLQDLPIFSGGPSATYRRAIATEEAAAQQLQSLLTGAQADSEAAARERRSAITAVGEAQAAGERAKQDRAQQLADMYKGVIQTFGADVLNPDSISARLVKEIRTTETGLREQLQEIQRRSGVTVLDDPLAFIINAIELPSLASSYNTGAAHLDTLKAELTRNQQQAQNYGNLNAHAIPAITREEATAAAHAKLADARRLAAEADVAAINQKVSLAQVSFNATVQQVNIQKGLSDSEMQAAATRHQSMVESIKYAETAPLRLAALEKARDELDDARLRRAAIRNASAALGWPPDAFPSALFAKMSPQMQLRFISGGIAGDFGANAYDAYKTLQEFAGPQLNDPLKVWMKTLEGVVMQGREAARKEQLTGPKLEEFMAIYVNKAMSVKLAEPVTPSNSLLKELSPQTMAQALPNLSKSVAGTVLKPLIEMGGSPTTQTVVDTIASGLAEKGVPPQGQAYAIAQYYKANVAQRNSISNADAMRIKLPENYQTTLELPGVRMFPGRNLVVDLTKPESVLLYLTRKQWPAQGDPLAPRMNIWGAPVSVPPSPQSSGLVPPRPTSAAVE